METDSVMEQPSKNYESVSSASNKPDFLEDGSCTSDSKQFAKKEELLDRNVQIGVPVFEHNQLIASAICETRIQTPVPFADACLVVKNRKFDVHRLLVSAFSKKLKESFLNESSHAVIVENVEPEIMASILDFMYANMALLKESILLKFLEAARELKIDCLQTEGFQKLEQSLLDKNKSQMSNTYSDDMQEELAPVTLNFPPSLSVKFIEQENTPKVKDCGNITKTVSPAVQKNINRRIIGVESCNETSEKKKNHCCCCPCKKSSDDTANEEDSIKEDNSETMSIVRKLKNCGTVITSGGQQSILDIPAWLFSSSSVSLTPVVKTSHRENPQASNKRKSPATPTRSPPAPDDPVIIGSLPSALVRKNLQRSLQSPGCKQNTFNNQSKHTPVMCGPSSNNKQMNANAGNKFTSNRGHFSSDYAHQGRQHSGIQNSENPLCETSSIGKNIPEPQQMFGKAVFVKNRGRGRGFNKSTQHVQSGGICRDGKESTAYNAIYMGRGIKRKTVDQACNASIPPGNNFLQVTPKNDGKEPEITDTGFTVHLLDNAAEIFQDLNSFSISASTNDVAHLKDLENLKSCDQQELENSDAISPQLHRTSTPLSFQNMSEITSKAPEIIPSNVCDDLSGHTTKIPDKISVSPNFDGFNGTEMQAQNKDKSSPVCNTCEPVVMPPKRDQPSNETVGGSTEELAVDRKPLDSIAEPAIQPDSAHHCSDESTKMEKRKHASQPRKVKYCTVCHKMFSTKESLLLHMRTHSKEKSYNCSSCNYRGKFYSLIAGHVSKKHKRKLNDSEKECHITPQVDPRPQVRRSTRKKIQD